MQIELEQVEVMSFISGLHEVIGEQQPTDYEKRISHQVSISDESLIPASTELKKGFRGKGNYWKNILQAWCSLKKNICLLMRNHLLERYKSLQ